MGKISSGQNIAGQVTKQTLHGTKNNYIKKDKKPKFKNMPTGKVSLIDNVKAQNKNMSPQKNFQKHAGIKNNQHSPMEKLKQLEGKENSPKGKQNFPKGKQNSPKGKQTSNELQNKQGNKKTNLPSKKELEEMDDSDSDIDEGIVPQEEISMKDETFEDEESDSDVPDIFGASLAENSDIDDEDFEDEEEKDENEQGQNEEDEDEDEDSEEEDDDDSDVSEGKTAEQGGINMFRGIKSNIKGKGLKTSDDDEDDEDDEDEDEDDDEEDEDEDDTDSDYEADMYTPPTFDRYSLFSSDEYEDEDEDEDKESEENEEEEEEEESITPGLKALLGKSMTDDDDDEDFNEEDEDDEDDDISEEEDDEDHDNSITSNVKDSPKKNEQSEKSLTPEEQEEMNKKTIFIDNIPRETKAGTLKKVFSKYGHIDNLRFRGIIPKNFKTPKKVAAIKQDIHPKAVTVTAYINYKSEESAKKALCMSGKKFEGNYINVQIVAEQNNHDIKKSVFIGNLKFGRYKKKS